MHETSISQNIIEITRRHLPPGSGARVKSVRLKIGECSGIEIESLRFCFEALTSDTDLQGAVLDIEHIPFCVACRTCGETSRTEFGMMVCARCGSTETVVVSGQEMQVTEIELADEEVSA